jgi:hypothetical protein
VTPSLAPIPDLADPDAWVTIPGVPVLDEHTMSDPEKKLSVVVDADTLREIAANDNRRAAERHSPCPLIVGHTSDDPQAPERPVVGYAVNFRVMPFAPDPAKAALYCDYKIFKDKANVVRDFPRRSVELWWEKKEIDPIALLGGTTPERDLGDVGVGILKFRRGGDTVYRYEMKSPPEGQSMPACDKPAKMERDDDAPKKDDKKPAAPAGDDGGDDPVVAKVLASKPIAEMMADMKELKSTLQEILQEIMQGEQGEDHDADPDHAGGDDMDLDAGGDDPGAGPAAKGKGPTEEDRKDHEPGPVRFDYAAGYGGANGGYVPDMEPRKMNRTATPEQRRIAALEKTLQEQAIKLARADAEKLLAGLEKDENIVFADKDRELDLLAVLDDEGRKFRVDDYKINYQRRKPDPVAQPAGLSRFSRADDGSGGDAAPDDMDQVQAVVALTQQGVPMNEAIKKVKMSRGK